MGGGVTVVVVSGGEVKKIISTDSSMIFYAVKKGNSGRHLDVFTFPDTQYDDGEAVELLGFDPLEGDEEWNS